MHTNRSTPLPSGFQRLAWSNLAAQSAEQIALAAAPIVAVLTLGAGAAETGVLQTALTLPFLFFAIPTGLMVDRTSRRRLMVLAEAMRTAALLAVIAFLHLGLLTWPVLAVLGFIAVCGTVAFSVAAPALIPALVPAAILSIANTWIELARTLALAAGPALGGVLIGWIGASAAFGIAAVLSAAAVLFLSGLEEPARQIVPRRHPPLQEIRDGIAFVMRHELLGPVFATQLVFNTAFFLILAIFVPYAIYRLGLTASGVGVTLAMLGVGMVVGALAAPRVIGALRFGTVIAIGPIAGFTASIVMALTIWWPSSLFAGVSFFLLGIGPVLWVISTTTLRQSVTPHNLLGRVSAISVMAYGARPLGAAISALIAGLGGAEACLIAAVGGFALQALIIILSPVVRLARQPNLVTNTATA